MKTILSLLSLGLVLGFLSIAHAHAFLDSAEPKVGCTVNTSPTEVKIWFTEELKKDGSTLQVFDAKGAEVDRKDVHVDSSDLFLMTVSMPKLAAGTYEVIWHATARDTHHTTGTFTFTVATK